MIFIEQGQVFSIPHLSCTPEEKAENNEERAITITMITPPLPDE
jgi:hypothetical protein